MQSSPLRVKRLYSWWSDAYSRLLDVVAGRLRKVDYNHHRDGKRAHATKRKTLRTRRQGGL